MANDGDDQALYQLEQSGGTNLQFKVSHYPFFKFTDDYGASTSFNTSLDEYLSINWGVDGVHGDFDLDDDAQITFYACTGDWDDVIGGAPKTAPTTTTCHTVNSTAISENTDTQAGNRYMWDVRGSAIAAGDYFLYAHVSDGVNHLTVQYKADGKLIKGTADNRLFEIRHGKNFLPSNPVPSIVQTVTGSDDYEFRWSAFDNGAFQSGSVQFTTAGDAGDQITIVDQDGTSRIYEIIATGGDPTGTVIAGTRIAVVIGGSASATAQGLRSTSHGVSGALFPVFSGFLVLIAWNYPFLLYVVPLPIALIIYLFLEEPSTSRSQGQSQNRISLRT